MSITNDDIPHVELLKAICAAYEKLGNASGASTFKDILRSEVRNPGAHADWYNADKQRYYELVKRRLTK